ncbi:MAG: peptidylprolyl isomerase [Nitrospira sp.]|nr:peptidylprolyl isomerase [Nitrospira sp.]
MKKVAIVVLTIFLMFACAKKETPKGTYLAKVGSGTITQADFEREMKSLPVFAQKMFEGTEGKERFLDELVKKEVLYQEAVKKNLNKDAEYLKKVEDFKKITLVSLLLEKEIEDKAKVTDQEVKDYYDKNKADFAPINQIRASHILLKTEAEAKKVFERLKKGEDFAQIAKKSSIDPGSAKKGGDLGYISKGQMVREFEAAALKLKQGEISEPVKTQFGYHIIKVTDKKMGNVIDFEQVKDLLSQRLSAKKQKEVFDSYMEGLKKSYKVEINKDALSKLTPPVQQPEQTGEPMEAPKQETKETPKKKK